MLQTEEQEGEAPGSKEQKIGLTVVPGWGKRSHLGCDPGIRTDNLVKAPLLA